MPKIIDLEEKEVKGLVKAAEKIARYIHKKNIKNITYVGTGSKVPTLILKEVWKKMYPNEKIEFFQIPSYKMFVTRNPRFLEHWKSDIDLKKFESAMKKENPTLYKKMKAKEKVLIFDSLADTGTTLSFGRFMLKNVRGSGKGIKTGAFYASPALYWPSVDSNWHVDDLKMDTLDRRSRNYMPYNYEKGKFRVVVSSFGMMTPKGRESPGHPKQRIREVNKEIKDYIEYYYSNHQPNYGIKYKIKKYIKRRK